MNHPIPNPKPTPDRDSGPGTPAPAAATQGPSRQTKNLIGILALGLAWITHGQDANTLISQGRTFLAQKNLTNANVQFQAAVQADPNNATANVFAAATRLLTLANQPAGQTFLDRLGFAATNRNMYHWTAGIARDTNGTPLAPAGMSASDLTAFLRTNIVVALDASAANLAKVTDTNYLLDLSSNETSTVAVTLDYGDLLLIRAGLFFAEYLGYTFCSWNLDLQLATLRSLLTTQATSAADFLAQYPNLFAFATTNDLAAAQQAFNSAATLYQSASAFIRNRPANVTRLFNFDADMADSEARFRTTLADLQRSLNGPVMLTLNTNLTFDLGAAFRGQNPPRSFLPDFSDNAIMAGTLPDPTFGGVIQGLPAYRVERALGQGGRHGPRVPFVAQYQVPRVTSDGHVQLTLDALDGAFFLLETSTDLGSWTPLTAATVQEGLLSFSDPNLFGSPQRFYRARDLSASFTGNGTVFDVVTGNPIPNATVVLLAFANPGSPNPTAATTNLTDRTGGFLAILSTHHLPVSSGFAYTLSVTAPGYAQFNSYGGSWQTLHFSSPVYLARPNLVPPNDDFARRQSLTGANVTVTGYNFGANSESAEPTSGGGQTVWWTWTAPASGAAIVDLSGSSFPTSLAVYTGDTLPNLNLVASDSQGQGNGLSRVNFFVTAGTAYQIQVDGAYPGLSGRIVLNLQPTTPLPPQILAPPADQAVAISADAQFTVSATGTMPLVYQWRKDGADVGGATDASYWISNAQTNDTGSYLVLVTNAAGSVTSRTAVLSVTNYPHPYSFTTFAGQAGSAGSADGVGNTARFHYPAGLAVDSAGTIYVADSGNNTIRKVSASGLVTTLAGSAGNSGSADGSGSAARFVSPSGVAVDGVGNVYVADNPDNTIRKVSASGVVTTLAGSAGNSGSTDGLGSAARFYAPWGVAVDGAGNVYVADSGNNTIRKVSAAGLVTTLAGSAGNSGRSDGSGSAARFMSPSGVAVDGAGNVYVADSGNNTIRKVSASGVVTTLAGSAGNSGRSDGSGSAARFMSPSGVAVDAAGNVYIADSMNNTIRKMTANGWVTTLAGLAGAPGNADGTGSAAWFYVPLGVAVDSAGDLYVADQQNHTIRKGTP